jgi:arabinogalactan endo-1,4-beta-galactosidase
VKTLTKLERLLQQKDIFSTLRKINSGQIRSYNDLTDQSSDSLGGKTLSDTQAVSNANQRRAAQGDEDN